MSDPGHTAALARDLALRLLDSRFGNPYGGATGETPSALLVGEAPRDLSNSLPVLPVPDGVRVLGTLVREFPVVVLAASLAAEATLAFYAERLAVAGWTDDPRRRGRGDGGFAHVPVTTRLVASFYAPMGSTDSTSRPRPPQTATASPSCSRSSPMSGARARVSARGTSSTSCRRSARRWVELSFSKAAAAGPISCGPPRMWRAISCSPPCGRTIRTRCSTRAGPSQTAPRAGRPPGAGGRSETRTAPAGARCC
jgi:hypothetical protein